MHVPSIHAHCRLCLESGTTQVRSCFLEAELKALPRLTANSTWKACREWYASVYVTLYARLHVRVCASTRVLHTCAYYNGMTLWLGGRALAHRGAATIVAACAARQGLPFGLCVRVGVRGCHVSSHAGSSFPRYIQNRVTKLPILSTTFVRAYSVSGINQPWRRTMSFHRDFLP